MPKAETNPAKPPRFPFVAALLCAACLGAATWTWMRYSYAWSVTPEQLRGGDTTGHYLRMSAGVPRPMRFRTPSTEPWVQPLDGPRAERNFSVTGAGFYEKGYPELVRLHDHSGAIFPRLFVLRRYPLATDYRLMYGVTTAFAGRAWNARIHAGGTAWTEDAVVFDATVSRFHGASIAGLVVGAMGVFVFTVAFRHWLGERRKFREEARA